MREQQPTCCAVFGQHPICFDWGFDEEDEGCRNMKQELLQQIMTLRQCGVTQFLVACDFGVGLYAAEQINVLRETDPDLMLCCVTPHEEHATKWAPYLRERYFNMLVKCTHMSTATTYGQPKAQLLAYEKIIDQADIVLTVYGMPAPRVGRTEDQAFLYAKEGHEWQAKINNRTSGETGCPICNGSRAPKSGRDLNTMYPEIAKQWHPVLNGELEPTDVLPMSNRRVWWICEHEHVWQSKVYHRVEGRGCPYCCGQKPIVGHTDLATLDPELAAQWHPTKNKQLQPSEVTLKSHKRIWWICEKGHEWQATITDRAAGRGCPVCHNHQILAGYNDLQTVAPELAAQWHPNKNGDLSPSMVMPHHNGRVWWVCEKGHEWQASPNNRMAGCGCPFCNQHRLIPEETSLAAVRPDIAAQWDYEKNAPDTPNDVTAYSNKKYWWRCNVGHHWMATVANRSYGEECPDCLNRKRRKHRYLP